MCTVKKLLIQLGKLKKKQHLTNRSPIACRQSIREKFKTASAVTSILLFDTDVEWDDYLPLITGISPLVN